MPKNIKHYNTIVLWWWQAGLASWYYLQKAGIDYCIVEKAPSVWHARRTRYDTLRLFSPRCCNNLPGFTFPGPPTRYPDKYETAKYLEDYVRYHGLSVQTNTDIISLKKQTSPSQTMDDNKDKKNNTNNNNTQTIENNPNQNQHQFVLTQNNGDLLYANNVILATWWFTYPYIPAVSKEISSDVMQLHSSKYRNPSQIDTSGSVVVVWNGNSGIQIADEIKDHAETYLIYKTKRTWIPKSRFWWRLFDRLGVFSIPVDSRIGKRWSQQTEPVIGYRRWKFFSDTNLHDAWAIQKIDGDSIITTNKTITNISTILWSTWFRQEWPYLKIDDLLDTNGNIIHTHGKTPCSGLYLVGLPWMRNKWSATIWWVWVDAKYIVKALQRENDAH